MDDSRASNLDQTMEQIRTQVRNSRLPTEPGSAPATAAPPGTDQPLQADLEALNQAYDLSRVSLDPNRRMLGRTILTAARIVGGLLKPIIRRQSEYNAANTRLTSHLKGQMDLLLPQMQEIRSISERTLSLSAEQFKNQAQALAQRFTRTFAGDVAMQTQALADFSVKLTALEKRQAGLEERARQIELLERRQTETRQELDRFGEDLRTRYRQEQDHEQRLQQHDQRLRQQEQRFAGWDQVNQRLDALDARMPELAAAIVAARAAQSEAEAQANSHYEEFRQARERLSRAERRLRRLLSVEAGNGAAAHVHEILPATPPAVAVMDYAGFEDRLRDPAMIKHKQRDYLGYFTGQAPLIDVGCGKGEFLELMREAGIEAKGVDLDLDMVLHCKERGLEVQRRDALDYLAEQPDDSVGGIFSAQVIEHLTSAQLATLVSLAWQKLKPGGVAILETLNPESLFVHYKWFWMDPSHVRLVHPQTLQFLLESAGFAEVSSQFASPPAGVIPIPPLATGANGSATDEFNRATDYLNKLIYGDQEYFVVARK